MTRTRDPFGPWRLLDDDDDRWAAEHRQTGYRLDIARDPIAPAAACRLLADVAAQPWSTTTDLGALVLLLDEVADLRRLGTGRERALRDVHNGWSRALVAQWRADYAVRATFDALTRPLRDEGEGSR